MQKLAQIALTAVIGASMLGCDYTRSSSSGDGPDATFACPTNIPQATDGRAKVGYTQNLDQATLAGRDFRRVLYTGGKLQLLVMAVKPGEHVGTQLHADQDQFFRIEEGHGEVEINGRRSAVAPATSIIVPAGAQHDIVNTGDKPLRLFILTSPPQYQRNAIRRSKADSESTADHFDGCLSE